MSVNRVACLKASSGSYVAHYVHHDKKTAAAVVFSSDNPAIFENADVDKFMHDCCLHIVAYTPAYLKEDDIPADYIAEQNELFKKQVASLDKPENVKAGIVKGKLSKHFAEICFLDQPFIDNEKASVSAEMASVAKKAGGSLKVEKIYFWKVGA